jgi:GxxExxY protein
VGSRRLGIDDALADLTYRVNGAAMRVHSLIGPGLPEAIYHEALEIELARRGIIAESHLALPAHYDGIRLRRTYGVDILVERRVVVELKAAEAIIPRHVAQLITYLRMLNLQVGLLYNFNVELFSEAGFRRIINPYFDPSGPSRVSVPSVSQ